jgi:hypothetical protein
MLPFTQKRRIYHRTSGCPRPGSMRPKAPEACASKQSLSQSRVEAPSHTSIFRVNVTCWTIHALRNHLLRPMHLPRLILCSMPKVLYAKRFLQPYHQFEASFVIPPPNNNEVFTGIDVVRQRNLGSTLLYIFLVDTNSIDAYVSNIFCLQLL